MLDRTPGQISGGQRQRVSIARALATRPKLLICDEPVSALDASNRNYILRLLDRTARQSLGLSIVIISHDLSSLAGIADRVVVLYRGQIVEDGPVGQVFSRATAPVHGAADGLRAQRPARPAVAVRQRPPVAPHRRATRRRQRPTARACSPPAARSPIAACAAQPRARAGRPDRWDVACHRHERVAGPRAAAGNP